MTKMKGRIFASMFLTVLFLFSVHAAADVNDLAKQADNMIRNAERNMFSGKNEQADELLKQAADLIEQGKAEDPSNTRMMSTQKKYERLRTAVDKKLGLTETPSSSSKQALPPKPSPKAMNDVSSSTLKASPSQDEAKLPSGVKKRLKDIDRHLDNAERYVSRDAKQAAYKLDQAEQLFGEIEKTYGGQFDPANPEFAVVKSRFDELTGKVAEQGAAEAKAKADEGAAKEAREELSAEWVAGFRKYLSYPGQEGHDPDMLVFVPGTSEPEKFEDAQKRFENFKQFYEAYQKTQFPNGKTWELEDLADNKAPMRIKDFEEGFASRVDSVLGDAEKEIDAAMNQLEKDNGWRSDKTVKPNILDHRRMASIQETTQKVISALGTTDSNSARIQSKFDLLVTRDKENRQIRKERTFMIPDRYQGSDSEALKKKAKALVANDAKEGGEPLRCTIISENWQERTVEEWTDTSKTQWRIRTTRSITAQVAAKTSDGVRLITVALAKDRLSDGTWGALYGNLHQYSEPMLASNVNQ